jgi:hypothetical protein
MTTHDHGGTTLGGWHDRSHDPAGQAPRLVIEWTAGL